MVLNIRNPETEQLAKVVSKLTGETKTQAVKITLKERLERIERERTGKSLVDELNEIALRCASLPVLDSRSAGEILNFSVNGVDSEALIIALKDLIAISNGSACTSQSYEQSHVLKSMGLPDSAISGAVRMSWCHMTPDVDWQMVTERIASLQG